MKKIIVASMRHGAGKTSIIVGLAEVLGKKVGYLKPLGDRMIYKKKCLWDYDAAAMVHLYNLDTNSEDICFGFDHAKLKYAYSSGDNIKQKLLDSIDIVGKDKDLVFIEGSKDLMCGSSINLSALTIAKDIDAPLFVVVNGPDTDSIIDDISFLQHHINKEGINFGGVIINKAKNIPDLQQQLQLNKDLNKNVVGIIPHTEQLTYLSVGYIAEKLLAKVITGDDQLDRVVNSILVGALNVDSLLLTILSEHTKKLVITGGDRSDLILTALESDTAAILLTNGVLPSNMIISKAQEKGVPLLLVNTDTYQTTKQIDQLEPLLTKNNLDRRSILEALVQKYIDLQKIV